MNFSVFIIVLHVIFGAFFADCKEIIANQTSNRGLGGVTFPKWNLFGNTKSRNQELKKPDRRFWPPQQKESRCKYIALHVTNAFIFIS